MTAPNQNPEQKARDTIDAMLCEAGWVVQNKSLTDLDNLPDPDILALDIIENLEAGLESFRIIATSLEEDLV